MMVMLDAPFRIDEASAMDRLEDLGLDISEARSQLVQAEACSRSAQKDVKRIAADCLRNARLRIDLILREIEDEIFHI